MTRKKQSLVLPDLEQRESKKNSTKKPIKGISSKLKPIIRRAPDVEMDPSAVRKTVVPGMNRLFRERHTHGLKIEERFMSGMADLTFGRKAKQKPQLKKLHRQSWKWKE
ncbi:hypothetical protein DFP73DRAFT_594773 [Morchella snyderi]|nr:hypothetical protein DFP73DRAFT_594773 [Morchella snyderi]